MTRQQLFEKRRQKKRRELKRKLFLFGIPAAIALAIILILVLVVLPGMKEKTADKTGAGTDQIETSDQDTAKTVPLNDISRGELGWNLDDKGWWYKTVDGAMYADGWMTLDDNRFYFDADGYILTGWNFVDGDNYVCFSESGIYQPDAVPKYVALTFDDGPSYDTDPILDVLEEYHSKATFFVVGSMADLDDTCRNALKRTYADGMEIGSHTWDHTTLSGASAETIQEVMQKNDDYIQSMIGFTPELMRPTGGGIDDTVRATVTKPMILWNVDTLDWDTKDPQNTFKVATTDIEDGSIILMHDIYEETAEAVKLIVPELVKNGYRLVTVSQLAEIKGVTLEVGQSYTDFTSSDS